MAAPRIQRVAIPSVERRTEPTPHVVYAVFIQLPDRSWTVYRRYSEFTALHAKLAPPPPPAPLPPKQIATRSLRMLTGLGGLIPPSDAQLRADKEATDERREGLELYLRAILSARDDRWRTNPAFLTFLQVDEAPAPQEEVRNEPRTDRKAAPGAPPAALRPLPPSTSLRPWSRSRAPATETDVTRPLSDEELLHHQNDTQMQAQDQQADQLAKILQRQRQLGLAIHGELNEHAELLTHLDSAVQQTRTRMDTADAQMRHLT